MHIIKRHLVTNKPSVLRSTLAGEPEKTVLKFSYFRFK